MCEIYDMLRKRFFVIVNLCDVDTSENILISASKIKAVTDKYNVICIFKILIDIHFKEIINIVKKIKVELNTLSLTLTMIDIYKTSHIKYVSDEIDVINIPSYVLDQKDILKLIAEKNKVMYIPRTKYYSANKIIECVNTLSLFGNNKIIISETWNKDGIINIDPTILLRENKEYLYCTDINIINDHDDTELIEKKIAYSGKLAISVDVNGIYLNVCSKSNIYLSIDKLDWLLQFVGIKRNMCKYNIDYTSSSDLIRARTIKGVLGTIESDASGVFGNYLPERVRGEKILYKLLEYDFKTVLDVGAGSFDHSKIFIENNKIVDAIDFGNSVYFLNRDNNIKLRNVYIGDFNTVEIPNKYDAIWCSHILEHQINVNIFLRKINSVLNNNGYLAIIVPIRKPFIVGGHVTLWNAGLLLYNLVLAGFNCNDCHILQYDYNIGIIVKKNEINDMPILSMDKGDIELLSKYFPFNVAHNFNGDIMEHNW